MFDCNSGASQRFAAPSLRLTEVVVYHTHRVFPLGGGGKPWVRKESCEQFLLDHHRGAWVGIELLCGPLCTGRGSILPQEGVFKAGKVSLILRVDQPSKHISRKGEFYHRKLGYWMKKQMSDAKASWDSGQAKLSCK